MILKKPYAFLIKYFKIIHFILFLVLAFIGYHYYLIFDFFNTYINNGYLTKVTYALNVEYVPSYLLLIIFIILLLCSLIVYLFVYKKKPYKLYLCMIIYYVIMLVAFLFLSTILKSFEEQLLQATSARAIRDILFMGFVPQIVFIIFVFIRSIGFNIKEFNFNSEIKELELERKDNEEVEVNISFDNLNFKSKFNKKRREFIYFFKENKFMFIIVLSISAIGLALFFSLNTAVSYDRTYSENREFTFNNLKYSVTSSMIGKNNQKGELIKSGKYYVVINMEVKNNSNKTQNISYELFKLKVNGKTYDGNLNYLSSFIDFAYLGTSGSLISGDKKNVSLVYEIDKEDYNKKMALSIFNGTTIQNEDVSNKYIYVNIKPINKLNESNISYSLGDTIDFNDTNLLNSFLTVTKASIEKKYLYKTKECDECEEISDLLTISAVNGRYNNVLLIINVDYILDEDTIYYKNSSSLKGFVDNFVYLDGISSINVTPSNENDFIAFEVDESTKLENLKLVVAVRNKVSYISLQ